MRQPNACTACCIEITLHSPRAVAPHLFLAPLPPLPSPAPAHAAMGKGKKRKAAALGAAAPVAVAAQAAAAPAAALRPAHKHTDAAPTGLGRQLASAPGRLASG